MKILFGTTGSVAAKLTPKILKKLTEAGHVVQIVATESSFYFWKKTETRLYFGASSFNSWEKPIVDVKVWEDKDEWPGDIYDPDIPIAHIELREWADALLIAPITANTIAKMANGFADNLLTCVTRAWDIKKPIVIAPAMNTHMWNHPSTDEHIKKLKSWHDLTVINPISKKLACGETGIGALADINDIVAAVNALAEK